MADNYLYCVPLLIYFTGTVKDIVKINDFIHMLMGSLQTLFQYFEVYGHYDDGHINATQVKCVKPNANNCLIIELSDFVS